MQKCYNCGKEVSDETLICPECGALVKRYTTPAPRLDEQPDEPGRRRRGDSRSIPSARTEASGATNAAACTSARG